MVRERESLPMSRRRRAAGIVGGVLLVVWSLAPAASALAGAPQAGVAQPPASPIAAALLGALDELTGTVGGTLRGATSTLDGTVGGTADTVGEAVRGLEQTVGATEDGLTGTVGGLTDTVGGTVGELGGTVGDTVGGLGDTVGGTLDGVTDTVRGLGDDLQPAPPDTTVVDPAPPQTQPAPVTSPAAPNAVTEPAPAPPSTPPAGAAGEPAGSPVREPAQPAPRAADGAPVALATPRDIAGSVAERVAFPAGLALALVAFLAVQGRIDRRDPKLALAPARRAPDLEFEHGGAA